MGCGPAGSLYLSTGGDRWPRPPWLAAATTDALPGRRNHGCSRNARKQACAGVQDEGTAHTLSGASLAHHDPPRAHARPPRRTCDERVACAPSRQHRGNAAAPTCTDKQSVSAPTWKHADCGQLSTERRREVASRGSRHAQVSRRPSLRAVRWKEGAVAGGRRARRRASWAAAMGTLLGTRRPRGLRKGGAAAGETGARIGGARAAGSGAAKPPSQPSVGASCSGVAVGSLGKRRSACDRPRPLLCAPRPATSSAAATRRRPSRAPSPSACPHQPAVQTRSSETEQPQPVWGSAVRIGPVGGAGARAFSGSGLAVNFDTGSGAGSGLDPEPQS